MHRSLQRQIRLTATVALVALGITPAALGYAGGPDRSEAAFARTPGSYAGGPDRSDAAFSRYALASAIRTPIAASSPALPIAVPTTVVVSEPEDGFAWRGAGGGAAAGRGGGGLVVGGV